MKRTTPFEHVIRAAVLTGLCIPLGMVIGIIAPAALAVPALIGSVTFLFVVTILSGSTMRTGRVTLALFAIGALAAGPIFFGLRGFCLLAVFVIWATRSVLSYSSVALAAADLMLSLAAFAAACWVWNGSSSLLLSVWTFFLLQGFSIWLPKSIEGGQPVRSDRPETADQFQRAYYSAEEALKRVIRTGAY